MESEITSEQAFMSDIETGISLNGILSGIPSSKYSNKYRTGYGSKYAPNDVLIRLSNLYNSLIQVETSIHITKGLVSLLRLMKKLKIKWTRSILHQIG